MASRKEVIKGLELCNNHQNRDCPECPYNDGTLFCADVLMHDALTLLEEREAVLLENQHKPYGFNTNANSPWISRCPRCGKKVEGKQTRFCKYCGQAVNGMTELEKTIKGLELCTSRENCADCPFKEYTECEQHLMYNALDFLTLQKKQLEQYHKADAFLYTHGWKW